jgi:hypothetical protein
MHHEQLVERARTLREDGLPPKTIARELGVSIPDVVKLLNGAASVAGADEPQCWVSDGWSSHLDLDQAPHWRSYDRPVPEAAHVGGLAAVLVAEHGGPSSRAKVAGFLLDVRGPGVTSSLPPKPMSRMQLAAHRQDFFSGYSSHHQIPAELARELVFGAAAYARTLGLEPDVDFDATAAALGEPAEPSGIRFGKSQ